MRDEHERTQRSRAYIRRQQAYSSVGGVDGRARVKGGLPSSGKSEGFIANLRVGVIPRVIPGPCMITPGIIPWGMIILQ